MKIIKIKFNNSNIIFTDEAWKLFEKTIQEEAGYFLKNICDFIDSICDKSSQKYEITKDHIEKTNVIRRINRHKKRTNSKWLLIILDLFLYFLPLFTKFEMIIDEGKLNYLYFSIVFVLHIVLVICLTIKHKNQWEE